MNKNKILARICSVLACLLLVVALTVPCFAATPYDNLEENFYAYLDSVGVTNSVRTSFIEKNYNPFLFDIIAAGSLNKGELIDVGFFSSTDNIDFFTIIPATFVYRVNNEPVSDPYEGVIHFRVLDSRCVISFIYSGNTFIEISYNVNTVYDLNVSSRRALFSFDGLYVLYDAPSIDSLDIGIVLNNADLSFFNNFIRLIFGISNVGYPKTFVDSMDQFWHAGYESGVIDGNNDAYDLGYQNGYDIGASAGYASGYELGLQDGRNGDAYNDGYNAAVRDIKSGDFGRNFLSGIFTAPLDAMKEFNLVEWETEDGRTISINLISILSAVVGLSLFIWFLKMFAGG